MNLPMDLLQNILERDLPAPGSINFTNAAERVDIPLYRNIGYISFGSGPTGLDSSGEVIREMAGVVTFKKNMEKQRWELVYMNNEHQAEIERLQATLAETRAKLAELIKEVRQEFPVVNKERVPKPKKKR